MLLLPLALWACQGTLYPVAPDLPERIGAASPDPGTTPGTSPGTEPGTVKGVFGGQVARSGARYLEFLGYTPPRGAYTLYLFVWDQAMVAPPYAAGATAQLKLSSGRTIPMTAATNPDDGSLFFYAQPEASFAREKTSLTAQVTLGAESLTGAFQHPAGVSP